jgi:hypothetical protein
MNEGARSVNPMVDKSVRSRNLEYFSLAFHKQMTLFSFEICFHEDECDMNHPPGSIFSVDKWPSVPFSSVRGKMLTKNWCTYVLAGSLYKNGFITVCHGILTVDGKMFEAGSITFCQYPRVSVKSTRRRRQLPLSHLSFIVRLTPLEIF